MIEEKTRKDALEAWVYHIRKDAFAIVDETDHKSDADLEKIKNKAQHIVDFVSDLERHTN